MNVQSGKTWFYSTPCISQHHENPIRLDDNSLWMINGIDEVDNNCGNGSGAKVPGSHVAPFPQGPLSFLLEEDLTRQKVCQRSQTTTAALSPISSPDIKRRAAFFDQQRQRYNREWNVQSRGAAASGVKQQVFQMKHRHEANIRERRRMQSINKAFEILRHRIPTLPYEKRLSKVDTLRLTINYIKFLKDLLATTTPPSESQSDGNGVANGAAGGRRSSVMQKRSFLNKVDPQAVKKIIVAPKNLGNHCFDGDPGNNLEPLIGHSLSWSFDSKHFADGWYPKVCGIFYSSDHRPLVKTRLWKLPRSNNNLPAVCRT